MATIIQDSRRIRFYAAAMTLAALVIAVLAVTFATGPAWAGVVGTVPDPCGPGRDNFPDNPAAQKSSGHYAIFDAYWLPDPGLGDDVRDGTLNNNLCPPSAKHEDKTDPWTHVTVEETTLTPADIDLRTTVIHVNDTHEAFVVAKNSDAGTDKLSLEKYDGVRRALGLGKTESVGAGTQVHWLRLEDPDLGTGPSSLVLGFSTGLLSDDYWRHDDEHGVVLSEFPFQYELESVRYHGPHAAQLPQVLTFWEPELGSGLVWNSLDTDVNTMPLRAGEYEHLEWVFTHPGTYVLEVHLKGHVRQVPPDGAGNDWKKITDKDTTVTSEVREYVFQVGPLTLNHDPVFQVVRSVKENTAIGTLVGDPIPVHRGDNDPLTFTLTGPGHGQFSVEADSDGNAQIKVAGDLDYETKRSYGLTLGVSDGKDHEGNDDDSIDDTIPVRISVQDVTFTVDLSNPNPRAGESVTITLTLADPPPNMASSNLSMYLEHREGGHDARVDMQVNHSALTGTATVTKGSAQTVVYRTNVTVFILDGSGGGGGYLEDITGDDLSITWQENPSQ